MLICSPAGAVGIGERLAYLSCVFFSPSQPKSDDERLAEPAASLLLGLLRHQPATTDHLLAFAGLEKALSKWRGYAFDRQVVLLSLFLLSSCNNTACS